MKKINCILIIIMLLIITGCSNEEVINHNYTYRGENEFWTAEYKVNGTGTFKKRNGTNDYESNSNSVLTVTYKRELSEIASVKHLEISCKSSAKGNTLINDFDKNNPLSEKIYTIKTSSAGALLETKDEIVKVNINIDGKNQTIELKNIK